MVAGTTGLEGSARGRMVILAAVIAAVAGFFCAFFAGFSCAVVSGVIAGAHRRGGTAALAFLTILAALLIAVITVVWHPFAVLPIVALIWLAISRRRRAAEKHAGLRVLR